MCPSIPSGLQNLRLVLISNFSQNFILEKRMLYFCDIRDKNAVNQGFWSKTAVFSLPTTKNANFFWASIVLSPQCL